MIFNTLKTVYSINNVFLMKYKKIHEIMIAIDASTYPISTSI